LKHRARYQTGLTAPAAAPSPSKAVATHPLDGLTADEMIAVVKILRDARATDDKSFFPLIERSEPL